MIVFENLKILAGIEVRDRVVFRHFRWLFKNHIFYLILFICIMKIFVHGILHTLITKTGL
jgi:ABC-type polysaccharide transport system permease subunit